MTVAATKRRKTDDVGDSALSRSLVGLQGVLQAAHRANDDLGPALAFVRRHVDAGRPIRVVGLARARCQASFPMRSVQVVAAGADHDRPGPTSAPDAGLSVGPSALVRPVVVVVVGRRRSLMQWAGQAAHLVCDAVPEHIIRVSVLRLPAFGDVGAFRLARCLPRMRALRHLQIRSPPDDIARRRRRRAR